MKIRPALSLKILALAFLNVILLAFVFFMFARLEFRLDPSSFLLGPARDRMLSVSRLLALELPETSSKRWSELLARYSNNYSVDLYLFDDTGKELAGTPVTPPHEITDFIGRDFLAHDRAGNREGRPVDPLPPDRGAGPGGMGGHPPLFIARSHSPELYWACAPIPIWRGEQREPLHLNVVWRFPALWTNPFFFDYRPWLAVILAIVLVSAACWLPLIRGLTRNIGQMTRATGQIAEGHFEIALPESRRDELGQLSESINRMAHRISDSIEGQRRFLSDIAHELTSPVARMQFAVGILQQRVGSKAAEYVTDVEEELTHMSSLLNELLSFSKTSMRSVETSLSPVNVAELAVRVVEREAPAEVNIHTDIDPKLSVLAQPDYLYRSLANLVRNAVRYAGSDGPIELSAIHKNGETTISVSDCGPGLPEKELENVLKPFYRPEFARQRETGGAGLGLAIVKSSIEACRGSVICQNRSPHGLRVSLTLSSPDGSDAESLC